MLWYAAGRVARTAQRRVLLIEHQKKWRNRRAGVGYKIGLAALRSSFSRPSNAAAALHFFTFQHFSRSLETGRHVLTAIRTALLRRTCDRSRHRYYSSLLRGKLRGKEWSADGSSDLQRTSEKVAEISALTHPRCWHACAPKYGRCQPDLIAIGTCKIGPRVLDARMLGKTPKQQQQASKTLRAAWRPQTRLCDFGGCLVTLIRGLLLLDVLL